MQDFQQQWHASAQECPLSAAVREKVMKTPASSYSHTIGRHDPWYPMSCSDCQDSYRLSRSAANMSESAPRLEANRLPPFA